jgi:hypothetical protein
VVRSQAFLLACLLFFTRIGFGGAIQSPGAIRSEKRPLGSLKGSTAIANDPGCALVQIVSKSGTSVLFVPTESRVGEPLRHVVWRVGAAFARPIRIADGRILDVVPGSANGAWVASVQSAGDLRVYRLAADNVFHAEGTLHPEGTATTISWAQDGSGGVWLFLETISQERRFIEAFRKERSKWRAKGIVAAGNLLTPRGVPGERSVICGQWFFSAEGQPRRIPVEGQPDLAETYPGRDRRLTELSLSDLSVRTSDDRGLHWILAPTPWPADTQFAWAPEAIDQSGDAPTVRWVAGGRLVIKRFSGGSWRTVLDTSIENVHGLSGPAISIGHRLLLFDLCYRTEPGRPDSIRIGVVDHGSVHVSTVKVR